MKKQGKEFPKGTGPEKGDTQKIRKEEIIVLLEGRHHRSVVSESWELFLLFLGSWGSQELTGQNGKHRRKLDPGRPWQPVSVQGQG